MSTPRRTTGLFNLPALAGSYESLATLPEYSEMPADGERQVTQDDELRQERAMAPIIARMEPAPTDHVQTEPRRFFNAQPRATTPIAQPPTLPARPPSQLAPRAAAPMHRPPQQSMAAIDVSTPSQARPTVNIPRSTTQGLSVHPSPYVAQLSQEQLKKNIEHYKLRSIDAQPRFELKDEHVAYIRGGIDACVDRGRMRAFLRIPSPVGINVAIDQMAQYLWRSACHEANRPVPALFDKNDVALVVKWSLLHHITNATTFSLMCPSEQNKKRYTRLKQILDPLTVSAFVSDDPQIRRIVMTSLMSYFARLNELAEDPDDRSLVNHIRRMPPRSLASLVQKLTDSAVGPEANRSDVRKLWLKDFAAVRLDFNASVTLHKSFTVLVNAVARAEVEISQSDVLLNNEDGRIVNQMLILLATLLDSFGA